MAKEKEPFEKFFEAIHRPDICDRPGCNFKIFSLKAFQEHLKKEHPEGE